MPRYSPCLSRFLGDVLSRSQASEESRVGQDPKPGAERLMLMVVWLNEWLNKAERNRSTKC